MDLSRREFLASFTASSTLGLAGCLEPEAQKIWEGDHEDQEDEHTPRPNDSSYPNNGAYDNGKDGEADSGFGGPYHGFCDTRFRVPKDGAVHFRENSEISGDEILEGIISDNDDQNLEIRYLNRVKYLGDEGLLFRDKECFDYSPGGFRDTGYGEWHARCFEAIHEYEDSYLVETEAIRDTAGFDEIMNVPICIYDSIS